MKRKHQNQKYLNLKYKMKTEIKTTNIAQEKYNEVYNGSKNEIDKFLKEIEEKGVDWKNENQIYKSKDFNIFKRKCKNVYTIFAKGDSEEVIVVDFLTESELLSWMK